MMEEEEEARRKSEGRVAPFIGMIGRAVLQGDDGVRESRGMGPDRLRMGERLAQRVPCHELIKDEHDPARSAHTTLCGRPM